MSVLNLLSLVGIAFVCFVAWLGSEDRRVVPWGTILWGIGLQFALGLLMFVLPTRDLIVVLNDGLNKVLDASEAGARFLFGTAIVPDPTKPLGPVGAAGRWLARAVGTPYVAVPGDRLAAGNINPGFIIAFRSLPQVIFFSALIALMYRLNWIQPIVQLLAKLFRRTMRLSGAESLSGAANIFVGIESAIAVKPFLQDMTRSELCAILTSCFGSVASSVLGLYAGFLRPTFPTITGHLISASFMTIPACFVVSKLLVPELGHPKTLGSVPEDPEDEVLKRQNPMDSLILGALDGVKMAVGIAAVIIAILGLVELVNLLIASLSAWILGDAATGPDAPFWVQFFQAPLSNLLGALFLPFTFFTGVSLQWSELWQSSLIIGRRLIETNVPPYQTLATLASQGVLSGRAMLIISYALCGFAHIPSYGIFVGGVSSLMPNRRAEVAELGWKALWAGTLATLMTGCMVGLLYFGNAESVLGIPLE